MTLPDSGSADSIGRGRYRMIAEVGSDQRSNITFWRGYDGILDRPVGITVFTADSNDPVAAAALRETVQLAIRTARLTTVGAARVLDVVPPERCETFLQAGVVSEWTSGQSPEEIIGAGLLPPEVAADMLIDVAAAVSDAQREGLVLGCDHPHRLRFTGDGPAHVAFLGAQAGVQHRDDVRGLGALLYLLLTGYWPLEDGPPSLPAAPRDGTGAVLSPRALRPEVPLILSNLAVSGLGDSVDKKKMHTSEAMATILTQISHQSHQSEAETSRPITSSARNRYKLGIGITALVAVATILLGVLGLRIAAAFGIGGDGSPAIVVEATNSSSDARFPDAPVAAQRPVSGAPG